MTWLLTIRTASAPDEQRLVHGDLAAAIASLPDDEPMGVTAMERP